jgi:hypothetical protein
MLTPAQVKQCAMTYTYSEPLNLTDPMLGAWSEPITIVDGRVDGVQPRDSYASGWCQQLQLRTLAAHGACGSTVRMVEHIIIS